MIREMRDSGMKITEIAKDLGMSRPTVRKYLKARRPPEYGKKRRVFKLEEFKPYIKERIDRDCVKIIKPCISRLSEAIGLFMKPYYTM